jgi:hypothetical protein
MGKIHALHRGHGSIQEWALEYPDNDDTEDGKDQE